MKEVKAFVHYGRVTDIIHALEDAGFRYLSVSDVKGLLQALSAQEQTYSMELGELVTKQIKLEVFCEDDQAERAVQLIRLHGQTGQSVAGWVYLSTLDSA
ncbi:P-II family nitrogen regulator [Oleiagrimonas sp. MCCC 1A03011]|uniref:P-II family nitrogen regulator n=1 Tax=Oleiagrimonas sp. MCCC 1A03011 TaxID=1926883 RepID=UPI000DC3D3E7|nr:P-II family nitrogen regulator [Oleiagrimonas sp. MCCC 1A03011]RAP56090.1 transcriptional regulator [Oleiagrimonas sp. MCCC 1A03011]